MIHNTVQVQCLFIKFVLLHLVITLHMFSKGITSFRNKTTETTGHLKVLHVLGLNVSSCVALFGAECLVTNSAGVFSVVETDQTIQILVLLCKAS